MNIFELNEQHCMGGWYISENICDNIINYFNENKEQSFQGITIDENNKYNINGSVKDSIDIMIDHRDLSFPFRDYRAALQNCLMNYIKKFKYLNSNKKFNINEPYNIQYYKPKGGYKIWHFENATDTSRLLAFMTYLNDVEDGGTEFKYQKITTPAKKGLTLLWPAGWTHTHRGQISKDQEKYIITGWYSITV